MTVHVHLSPELESYKAKVNSGVYHNANELIRDAIRRMQADEERLAAFRLAVSQGEEQLDRGEGRTYTPEVMEEIAMRARENQDKNTPIDPDVVP